MASAVTRRDHRVFSENMRVARTIMIVTMTPSSYVQWQHDICMPGEGKTASLRAFCPNMPKLFGCMNPKIVGISRQTWNLFLITVE